MGKIKILFLVLIVILGIHHYQFVAQAEEVTFPETIANMFPDANASEKLRSL